MQQLAIRLTQPDSPSAELRAAVRFDVSGEHGGSWVIDFNQPPSVTFVEQSAKPIATDCTFRLEATDFSSLFEGKVTGQQLFFDGRMDIDGDLMMTLKLPALTRLLSADAARTGHPGSL